MMQMLGRLMWIGVGAVAVKALEAGLRAGYLDPNGHGQATRAGNGNGNGHGASSASTAPKRTRRRARGSSAASH